jgi:hypothetical protein
MKVSKSLKLPVVYVEWDDSISRWGWRSPNSGDKAEIIRSVGILVSDLKHHVTLSASKAECGDFLDQVKIPRACIRRLRRL